MFVQIGHYITLHLLNLEPILAAISQSINNFENGNSLGTVIFDPMLKLARMTNAADAACFIAITTYLTVWA
jgi:hypothetical protein